jgi:hypothetical protein
VVRRDDPATAWRRAIQTFLEITPEKSSDAGPGRRPGSRQDDGAT